MENRKVNRKRGGKMKRNLLLFVSICTIAFAGFGEFLVIYPDNFALVGSSVVINSINADMEVLSGILPDTFKTFPSFLKASYESKGTYNLQKILSECVGKEINWLYPDGSKGIYTLISSDPILLKGEEGIFEPQSGTALFSTLPVLNPSPVMRLTFPKPVETVDVLYQVNGLGWEALYSIELEEKEALLKGNLKIQNTLEESIQTDKLVLFSGSINRVSQSVPNPMMSRSDSLVFAKAVYSADVPVSFSGYMLYPIPGTFRFERNQSTYYQFFESRQPYERRYTFTNYYYSQQSDYQPFEQTIFLAKLSQPLPAGKISVFQNYAAHTILLGEANVPDKPAEDSLDVSIGKTVELQGKFEITESREELKMNYQKFTITVKNFSDQTQKAFIYTYIPKEAVLTQTEKRIQRSRADILFIELSLQPKMEEEIVFGIRYPR